MENINEQVLFDALGDPEALEKAVSRREAFGSMGGWGKMLALASVPFGLAALTRQAFAQQAFSDRVLNALNVALTLERLEAEFYSMVLASSVVPSQHRGVFELITANEIAHRDFLEGLLGAQAARRPQFDFTAGGTTLDPFNDYNTTLILTQGFEDTGVRAYKGQAPALQGNDVALTMGLRIHSVEARQASLVRRLRAEHLGRDPEQAPFKGWPTIPPVDDAAEPFIGAVYAVGMPASMFPPESNTVHAGIDVAQLAAALTGDEEIDNPQQAAEAFDEPLDLRSVLAIAGMFGRR